MRYKRTTREPILPIGPSIGYLVLSQGKFSLLDWDDAVSTSQWRWSAMEDETEGTFYAIRGIWFGNGKIRKLRLHNVLLGPYPEGLTGDHINGNSLDNRRCNLRLIDRVAQAINRRTPKNNTSGCKGVIFHKYQKKWVSRISFNGETIDLGYFVRKVDAIAARLAAVEKYHGKFTRKE